MSEHPPGRPPLGELFRLFTTLGFTAFGGPAAHIAMMHDEVVTRRRWMADREFLDLVGATNLIPGPNSTEIAIHIGRKRAGWRGLLVAGTCFIVPASAIVLVLAWAYVEYGTTPEGEALLYGIAPVIIAIVLQALVKLVPTAASEPLLAAVGLLAFGAYLIGVNELVIVFGAGIVVMLVRNARRIGSGLSSSSFAALGLPAFAATVDPAVPVSLGRLFLTFLKIGSVLFGSGYVLLAYLRTDFVEHLGWITEGQLVDAVAIGQFTPGPVSSTATFVGYLVLGVPGAIVATLGIFIPSFVFVALSAPLLPKMRSSAWFGAALDGVNVGSIALMAGVLIQLGREAVVDWPTAALAVVAVLVLFATRLSSAWLVVGGGLAGLAIEALR